MQIKADIQGMDGVQRELRRVQDSVKRGDAIAAALNKVAAKASAELTRAVTERYAIKASEVRASVYVRRASRQRGDLTAVIDVFGSPSKRGRSMNMVRFLAAVQQQKTRGSRVGRKDINALGNALGFQVIKGGGLKKIDGAFLGNKGRTVFRRTGDKRLPIEAVQVIGVSQMFRSRAIRSRVMKKIDTEVLVEVQRAVRRILDGAR